MLKENLVAEMSKSVGGAKWINKTELGRYLGCSRSTVANRLCGIRRVGQRYYIPDVANAIIHQLEV